MQKVSCCVRNTVTPRLLGCGVVLLGWEREGEEGWGEGWRGEKESVFLLYVA